MMSFKRLDIKNFPPNKAPGYLDKIGGGKSHEAAIARIPLKTNSL